METDRPKTAWEGTRDKDDVIRFVLRRSEWNTLIEGLATNLTQSEKSWNALEVVRHAQIDVEASAMVKALTQIVKYAQVHKPDRNDMEIILQTAKRGLQDGAPEAKEQKVA
jgi:hypothetical protein